MGCRCVPVYVKFLKTCRAHINAKTPIAMKILSVLLIAALMAFMSGCATMSDFSGDNTRYQQRLGEATALGVEDHIPRLLRRYDFDIKRQEDRRNGLYYITYWMDRDLFDDEKELEKVQAARTRIEINTSQSGGGTSLYHGETLHRITFSAETQFRKEGEGWVTGQITDQCSNWLDSITREMRTRVTEGARQY